MCLRLHSRLLAIVRGKCAALSWLRHKGGIWLALTDRANQRCGLAGEERAQATVEMAVVVPVLLVLALIVYNIMLFVAATARFDRIAPDIVAAHAVSPSGESDGSTDDSVGVIESQIEGAMAGYDVEIEVTCTEGGASSGDDLLTLIGGLANLSMFDAHEALAEFSFHCGSRPRCAGRVGASSRCDGRSLETGVVM